MFTVSGTADPATGTIAITTGGECTAAVDEVTGGFECELPIFQSTPALEIRAQYHNDADEFEVLGAATVSVILPPELAGVSYDGESPTQLTPPRASSAADYRAPSSLAPSSRAAMRVR